MVALTSCSNGPQRSEVGEAPPSPPPTSPQPSARAPAVPVKAPVARMPAAVPLNPLVEPEIRVAVLKDQREVRLRSGSGTARALKAATGWALPWRSGEEAVVAAGPGGLSWNGQALGAGVALDVREARAAALLQANGVELAPRLSVFMSPQAPGTLCVAAHLELEDYLAGVLAGEVPYERWHAEALKAQAVTSRTYALSQMQLHARDPYDVEATVQSQVFKPGFRNHPIIQPAIEATRGLALTFQGRIFPAYFHSTCGGRTAAADRVFADQAPLKPLSGVACPFCEASPAYRWRATFTKADLRQRLSAAPEARTPPLGALRSVEFIGGGGAGAPARSEQVRVVHAGGTLLLPANRFRLLAGPRELKSVQFESVTDHGESLEFAGRGYGHGAGLCQFGSQGMALKNYRYTQILGLYYPGAELTKMYGQALAKMP